MKRLLRLVAPFAMIATLLALWMPAAASADFGFKDLDVTFTDSDGSPTMQAGSHPFEMTTLFEANTTLNGGGLEVPDGEFKDLEVELPPGLVGTPTPVPPCSSADFLNIKAALNTCPESSIIGQVNVAVSLDPVPPGSDLFKNLLPVYNLIPPPGVAAKMGFVFTPGLPITIETGVNPDPPYNLQAHVTNIAQAALVFGSRLTLWGNPADPAHDGERGGPADIPQKPFLTLPRSCTGPLATVFRGRSWQDPGQWVESPPVLTHDASEPPNPLGIQGCEKLDFAPRLDAQPTSDHAESPTGLEVSLDIDDEGLTSPTGLAHSDIRKIAVTLPEGVTANPSLAEGLAVCTPAQFDQEALDSEGCPGASKIGTLEAETPLIEGETFKGQLFIAEPHQNPFDTLLALYLVIKHPKLGILVKVPGKVEPDPQTGQLVTTFGEDGFELPQFPLSHVRLRLREGGRSPLITPPACGTYETKAIFTPWANPSSTYTTTSSFQITSGVGGSGCPSAGPAPFSPGFEAGSLNNNAKSFSPFYMRLTRRDGDQDLTRFDATLPPGMIGKIAGVEQCPEAAIALAKTKSGKQELASPSCPINSRIGRTMAGAGVGSQLTYVPGSIHLAGPFGGAPLSVVAVTPAVAGPFDVGTVVVRQALMIDSKTALVKADGALSDPIPHILAGIPLRVRDIRVYVDRPDFTLNPTSCRPSATRAELWGGGLDVFSTADDAPASRSARFQAAACQALGFKPRLDLRLKGGTKRGGHPALTAVLHPRAADANISGASATLPRSEFLDQAHIRTICTRVQFAADNCPVGAIYGRAMATTPLLDFPLSGPVYLRSSDNLLPDLVADLRGPPSLPIKFEVVGRTDSVRGGIRNTFEATPDVPVAKFVLSLQGGRKGLLVNSTNICRKTFRAKVRFSAHNGRRVVLRPALRAPCKKNARQAKAR